MPRMLSNGVYELVKNVETDRGSGIPITVPMHPSDSCVRSPFPILDETNETDSHLFAPHIARTRRRYRFAAAWFPSAHAPTRQEAGSRLVSARPHKGL